MTPLLAFYFGSHPDHRGRMLAEIVKQDDDWLETAHDYIQWLFPLTEHSRVIPGAPTLSPSDIKAFRTDALLREHMLVALRRMLRFYGLQYSAGVFTKGANWNDRKSNWFTEPTHNNLRITRILRSLVLVGLEAEATRLHTFLAGSSRISVGSSIGRPEDCAG
jgi:hypothetical protein